jgi:hypothetical protein
MTRRIVIASEERDLLCHRILIHLSGIDRVWLTADSKNLEGAVRLGRQVCDELQLVLDDLGREDASEGAPVELTCGPEVVRRVVEFVRDSAVAEGTYERKWRVATHVAEEENRRVRAMCEGLLEQLGGARSAAESIDG